MAAAGRASGPVGLRPELFNFRFKKITRFIADDKFVYFTLSKKIKIMKIADEDVVLIKNLYLSKGWGARKLMNEFPDKGWKLGSIDYLMKKIHKTSTFNRQPWQWQTAFGANW